MFAVGSPLAGGITPAQTRARLLSIPSDAFGIDLCLVVIAVDVLGYLRYDSIAAVTGGAAAAAAATAMVMVGVVPKFLFGLNVHGRMLVLKMVLGARLCLCGIGRIRTIKVATRATTASTSGCSKRRKKGTQVFVGHRDDWK